MSGKPRRGLDFDGRKPSREPTKPKRYSRVAADEDDDDDSDGGGNIVLEVASARGSRNKCAAAGGLAAGCILFVSGASIMFAVATGWSSALRVGTASDGAPLQAPSWAEPTAAAQAASAEPTPPACEGWCETPKHCRNAKCGGCAWCGAAGALLPAVHLPPPPEAVPPPPPPEAAAPPPPDVACYASRYPDLLDGFCGGTLSGCDYSKLADHFEQHGCAEGRVFTCTGLAAPCPAKPPPPPPPPPPPVYREIPDTTSKEARSVIDGLNARFAAAHPSSDLNVAGVIMRAFDGLSNPGREWEPCVKCKSPNRFPTSLAFPGHTDIYSNGPGGWIIRPIGVGILCSCYADCGSQGWGAQTVGCAGRACDPSYGVKQFGCNWKGPETLQQMMEQQVVVRAGGGYNEVVLDPGQWAKHMPRTVEAMFVLPRSRPADVQKVRRVHAEFCKAYGLKGEKAPPIVVYDPSGQTLAPFRPFSSGEGCDADCEQGKGRRELGNGGWHAAHDSAAQKEADAHPFAFCLLCRCSRCAKCEGHAVDPCKEEF